MTIPNSRIGASWPYVVLLALGISSGCGDSTRPVASDYDQTCTQNDDCVVVDTSCCCGSDAINRRDLDELMDDLEPCELQCDAVCEAVEAFCNAGTCDVRPQASS